MLSHNSRRKGKNKWRENNKNLTICTPVDAMECSCVMRVNCNRHNQSSLHTRNGRWQPNTEPPKQKEKEQEQENMVFNCGYRIKQLYYLVAERAFWIWSDFGFLFFSLCALRFRIHVINWVIEITYVCQQLNSILMPFVRSFVRSNGLHRESTEKVLLSTCEEHRKMLMRHRV